MAEESLISTFVYQDLPVRLDRRFQVDSMYPTDRQLLLRSHAEKDGETRVDILFKSVRGLRIPVMSFPSLVVRHGTQEEIEEVEAGIGSEAVQDATVYIVEAGPRFGYVVALAVLMAEDLEPGPNPSPLLAAETGRGKPPDQVVSFR